MGTYCLDCGEQQSSAINGFLTCCLHFSHFLSEEKDVKNVIYHQDFYQDFCRITFNFTHAPSLRLKSITNFL